MKPSPPSFSTLQADVSKSTYWVETSEGHAEDPPDWMLNDPGVYRRYSVDIATVKLAKLFGWTLEYSRKVALDPFKAAVCYGVIDGLNKAAEKKQKG